MEPEKTPRERAEDLISLLVSDWRPTRGQVLWTVRIIIVLVVLQALFVLIGTWLWEALAHYVHPRTPSDRKDLVNVFVVIGVGVVGFLTATAAVGNLYISRRNLQQQRVLEQQRAQDDALQAYYKQMGDLLTEHDLKKSTLEDDVALLAQAQTLTVVGRLDAIRKSDLVRFLYSARLIIRNNTIVHLIAADLSGADLSETAFREANFYVANLSGANLGNTDLSGAGLTEANLSGANLSGATLISADLRSADLEHANLTGAYLSGTDLEHANLTGAYLAGAYLSRVNLSGANLIAATGKTHEELEQQAYSLEGATMPNGQKYEDWLKSKD